MHVDYLLRQSHLYATTRPPPPLLEEGSGPTLSTSLRNIAYRIANGTLKVRRHGGRVVISHAELLRQASLDDNAPVAPKRSSKTQTTSFAAGDTGLFKAS
ncbi:hypothetical protein HDF10_003987 [Edaphobacter lichenicola]|uniref:Uncharacterized protein n=1 Tax=Tunturiibacter lichenicola TaxID=2051959 RepID=A0A7W8N7E9_9BACT|nr:hypothetical protein [Edaphobacter lichenicola]